MKNCNIIVEYLTDHISHVILTSHYNWAAAKVASTNSVKLIFNTANSLYDTDFHSRTSTSFGHVDHFRCAGNSKLAMLFFFVLFCIFRRKKGDRNHRDNGL